MACAGTFINEYTLQTWAGLNFSYFLLIIIISYIFIPIDTLKMCSSEGIKKAFSTCGSHLITVIIFYGTLFFFMYLRSPTEESVEQGKMVTVFYTTFICGSIYLATYGNFSRLLPTSLKHLHILHFMITL